MKIEMNISRKSVKDIIFAISEFLGALNIDESVKEEHNIEELSSVLIYLNYTLCEEDPRIAVGFTKEEGLLLRNILKNNLKYSKRGMRTISFHEKSLSQKTISKLEILLCPTIGD